MSTRRTFLRRFFTGAFGLGLFAAPFGSLVTRAWGQEQETIVPQGTPWTDLRNRNPKDLDTSQLDLTPLKDFGTMGLDDHQTDLEQWRLIVDGHMKESLSLAYSEVLAFPALERQVLMICPGFFANNGSWKGVSIKDLMGRGHEKPGVTHVTFRGPAGNYEKVLRVPLEDALSEKVFLAYQVNGEPLPKKHGFPLRVVAEGYYGSDWVKYVCKVTFDVIQG
jgi:sulfoxide reductase catalytic subunit YedY